MLISTTGIQGRMEVPMMIANGTDQGAGRLRVFDIMAREVGTWTIVNNIASATGIPTTGFVNTYRWSPNGQYLAWTHSGSPYLYLYKRIGNVLTKLNDPASLPPNFCPGVCWHPSGRYVATTQANNAAGGQVRMYKQEGETFTYTTATFDVAITATVNCSQLAFNPQGDTLAIACNSAPYYLIYKFDESTMTFTKIVDPLPTGPTARSDDVAWSHDGRSLAITSEDATRIRVYNRSGDTFTKIANPAELPAGSPYGCAWGGKNSEYLVVSHTTLPRVTFYYREGDILHKATNPATLPANNAIGCNINAEGTFVVVGAYLAATKFYRRDPATTSTWIDIGQNIANNPTYGKYIGIYPCNPGK